MARQANMNIPNTSGLFLQSHFEEVSNLTTPTLSMPVTVVELIISQLPNPFKKPLLETQLRSTYVCHTNALTKKGSQDTYVNT